MFGEVLMFDMPLLWAIGFVFLGGWGYLIQF